MRLKIKRKYKKYIRLFLENKSRVIIIAMIVLLFFIVFKSILIRKFKEKKFLDNSPYCLTDKDCSLYNCTNCGNNLWIDKNIKKKNAKCTNRVPGLVGCECIEGQCKRKYEK